MDFSSKSITNRTKLCPTVCSPFSPRNSSRLPTRCAKSPPSSAVPSTSRLALSIFHVDDSCGPVGRSWSPPFRGVLLDRELLLISQPHFEMLSPRPAKILQDDPCH